MIYRFALAATVQNYCFARTLRARNDESAIGGGSLPAEGRR